MRPEAEPRTVAVLGLLAALKAAGLVLLAEALARGITATIAGEDAWRGAVVLGLVAALVRAVAGWASQAVAARAATGAKERIRHDLAAHLLAGGRDSSGELPAAGSATAVGAIGLDELDDYYRVSIPAIVSAAVIPLLVGARILFADWPSALIIVLTVPLVPVFMTLVGRYSAEEADAASASQQRLSDHLLELARGLPVLVGLGRVEDQARALHVITERVRTTTMRTLRTAFLSALVLELIATISVAVVAVVIGVRLISGGLPLSVGLVALLLAPECYAPFRELGAAFHSSQGGLAALRRAGELSAGPLPRAPRDRRAARIRLDGVSVRYPDRALAALDGVDVIIDRGSVTAITGSSGAGKSTMLGLLAGVIEPTDGEITGVDRDRVAWVPQHPFTVAPTVREELALYAGPGRGEAVERVLTDLDLHGVASADPARISPGELRRVAVARGLLRVSAGADLLLLDEPTAHLDAAAQERVELAIAALPHTVTVVVASHEEGMLRLARQRIVLDGQAVGRQRDDALLAPARTVRDQQEEADDRTASAPAALSALLGGIRLRGAGAAAIDHLIATADRVRDLLPRVIMPPAVAALGSLGALVATALLSPPAVPGLALAVAVALLGGPAAAVLADRSASAAIGGLRSEVLRGFGSTLLAANDLRANGAAARRLAELDEADARLGARARVAANAQGLGAALVVLAMTAASVLIIPVEAAAVASGALGGEILAVLVLLPLGLIEPMLSAVTAAQQLPALRAALRKADAVSATGRDHDGLVPGPIDSLELRRLQVSWAGDEVYGPFDAAVRRGDWMLVAGPSGSGKSTLLATLLGYLPAASGSCLVNGRESTAFDSRALRDRFAWCPQEGYLFDSTLRGNLLLARGDDDRPSEREMLDALASAGLDGLLDTLRDGLDTRIGPGGSRLSGGQRQRLALARTLLTRAEVVLLDEPTAHLDAETAERVMASLRVALADRIVVLVTHHPSEAGVAVHSGASRDSWRAPEGR